MNATRQRVADNSSPSSAPPTTRDRFRALARSMEQRVVEPIGTYLAHPTRLDRLRHVPSGPAYLRSRYEPPEGAWPTTDPPRIPESIAGVPGVVRHDAAADAADRELPLQHFTTVHSEAIAWLIAHMWRVFLPAGPRLMRALKRSTDLAERQITTRPVERSGDELAHLVKQWSHEIGLSGVGVAPYDPRYTVETQRDLVVGDRIIVCVLEQNYNSTQTAPSARSEHSVLVTYEAVVNKACDLAERLNGLGYRTRVTDPDGPHMYIHYGVEAGLGQLGLNGQLLTRFAGSRCRLVVVETDAPIAFDGPKDFGVPAICDECQVCVRQCPSGAIPNTRKMHRGVLKAKINTGRCLPLVAQAEGCGVCMKVCPVQKYGLDAVVNEYELTGAILGKGTPELESYHWPVDGKTYGPGEKPNLPAAFFRPEDVVFDPSRTRPLPGAKGLFG